VVAQADQAVQTLTDTQSAVEKQEKELKAQPYLDALEIASERCDKVD
jgi:hypothetical protein